MTMSITNMLCSSEFEQTLGDSGGQRSLAWYSPWGHRVRHNLMTEQQLFTYVRCSIKCCICIVSLNSGGRYSHYTVTVSPGTVLCEPGMPAGLPVSSGDRPPPGCLSSVQFSRSVVSDSLWPQGRQHTRLPCSSPTPGACSNSCPSSRWCHPTISSSVIPFSSCLQSFPASGSFLMSHQSQN